MISSLRVFYLCLKPALPPPPLAIRSLFFLNPAIVAIIIIISPFLLCVSVCPRFPCLLFCYLFPPPPPRPPGHIDRRGRSLPFSPQSACNRREEEKTLDPAK